jgi:putative oxidoreductase
MPILFVIGRILVGGYFLNGGYNHFKNLSHMAGYAGSKGVPAPKLAVGFSGLLLIIGGASILLGSWTNIGIYSIILFLIPVTFKMHAFWQDTDQAVKMSNKINFMKNVAILGLVLMLLSLPVPWMNSF